MATISLCMIVRDEEDTLGGCLESVKGVADEIIIADTGSVDGTKRVAAGYTDKIYDFEWEDDFAAARNFAFSKATMEYILWLDADDIIMPCEAEKLLELKRTLSPETDAVMMRYDTAFDAQGRATFSFFRERLSKRSRGYRWREPVHEYLEIWGNVINSDIRITHAKKGAPREAGRNIRIYEKLLERGGELSPRGEYYFARELKDSGRYAEAIERFCSFLDSGKGWMEDNIAACGELARCYKAEGKPESALAALLRSFGYDTPRAEICCQLGYHFKERGDYRRAAFWFELAAGLKKPEGSWGFFQEDCWGYIPSIECAVCYDRLGEYEKASRCNDAAGAYKPDSPEVLQNKRYFERRLTELGRAI